MKFKLILFFLILTVSLSARKTDAGEAFFNNKQYAKARTAYEQLLKQKPNDALYNFRYARCCYELKDAESAITHFEMSGNKFPMRDLYLGELYFNTYRFDEAIMSYQTYMATLKPDDIKLAEYGNKIKQAENAARLLTKVDDIAIMDSVVVNKAEFLKFYKYSKDLGSLKQEPLKLNSRRTVDKITYTTQRQDRIYFSDSIKGRMDIFTSYKLLDTWSKPISISDVINSSSNENYPFVLLDGVTVYFASDNENSIGGYDIFVTRFTPSSNSYLIPENIGFPFNSPANDYMMVIDEQHKQGWFASDRHQPAGKVMIYSFVPNEVKNVVKSEDKNYVRHAAQLKVYRKLASNRTDSVSLVQNEVDESENQMKFIINDTVVYTHLNQFKSVDAVKHWTELHKLSADIKVSTEKLNGLRIQYADSEMSADKKSIAGLIVMLEEKNTELEKALAEKTTYLRNAENKFLFERK